MGRLRRAMPMRVYVYICWQLKLLGNANLRLYQCWFVFTHRSPIKNFASCRLREKKFASLRLRKNMVELRARLSLLVDKTIFQYSVLTIYYTTIDGHAPSLPSPSARRGRRGRPGRDGITTRGRSRGRMGRARISTPPPPPRGKGKGGGRCAGSSPAPARRGGRDAPDLPDHPSASTRRRKTKSRRARARLLFASFQFSYLSNENVLLKVCASSRSPGSIPDAGPRTQT